MIARLPRERGGGQAARRAGPSLLGAGRGQRARDRTRPVAHERLRAAAVLGPRRPSSSSTSPPSTCAPRMCAATVLVSADPGAPRGGAARARRARLRRDLPAPRRPEQERFIDAFGEHVLPELAGTEHAPRPDQRPVVEERGRLLPRRRDLPRLGRRRRRRLRGPDQPDRLPGRARRHLPVADALLPVAQPRRRLRRQRLLRGRPAPREPRATSSSSCAPPTTAASR